MTDNFDLKKFLKENKALENLNPVFANESNSEDNVRNKIREMVIAELSDDELKDATTRAEKGDSTDLTLHMAGVREAKKKKDEEVEDVETTDTTIEDIPTVDDMPAEDEMPAEDTPTGGGLEDIAANMEGTESEVMDHLMNALKIAKGLDNNKLTTQIGNTLKFFVSEYIGGDEQ
jgi:hypothetical protein